MRILHAVEFYTPSRGGAQEVVRRISEAMVAEGHDVTVATTRLSDRSEARLNGVRIEEFGISGNAVRGLEGEVPRYQQFLAETDFDVVMTYAAQQWTTDVLLDMVDDVRAPVRLCAPCGYSGLNNPSYADYFQELPARLRRLDGTIYHSATYQDYAFAEHHEIEPRFVIPNGAAHDEFADLNPGDAAAFRAEQGIYGRFVLTVGTHTGIKGHRQCLAAFALARTGPATLVINGNGAPNTGCTDSCSAWSRRLSRALRAQGKRILLLDLDRHALVRAFKAADLLLFLSQVECSPVVLYESAAAGTPFLSVDVGNSVEIASWTGAGAIVPRRGAARALGRMLADDRRLSALGDTGRARWLDRFTWEAIAREYASVYADALDRSAASASPSA